MATSLNAVKLKDLINNIGGDLKSYSKTLPLIQSIEDKNSWSIGDEDKATLSLSGEIGFHVLNSKDDLEKGEHNNGDSVVGVKGSENPSLALSKPIEFDPNKPHCRYRLSAQGKGEGNASYKDVGFSFDISSGLSLVTHMPHSEDDSLVSALESDLASMPVILDLQDVKSLESGQAVSMSVNGHVTAGASFAWSDLLAGSIGALSAVLGEDSLVINIGAKATVDINFSLSGGFNLVYAKPFDASHIHLGLFKGDKTTFGYGIGLSVEAGFANPNAVKEFLSEYADQLFRISSTLDGELSDVIAKIKNASTIEELPDALLPVVEELRENFGLDQAIEDLECLQEKINSVEKEIEDTISEVAAQKANLSFSYQYNRIEQTQALIEAELEPNAESFDIIHANAIKGQFIEAVKLIANDDECKMTSFMRQTKIEKNLEYGFKFILGDLSFLGRDFKNKEEIITTNINNQKMIAFDAKRGYKIEYLGEKSEIYFDFDAHMESFSLAQNPTAEEFDFSLTLAVSNNGVKASSKEIIDMAGTWGIVGKADVRESIAALDNAVGDGTIKNVFSEISIDDEYFSYLLGVLIDADIDTLSKAFARALPYVDQSNFTSRSTAEDREQVYAPMFKYILNSNKRNPWQLSWADEVKKIDLDLFRFEYPGNQPAQSKVNTLAYVLYKHNYFQKRVNSFMDGIQRLKHAIDNKQSYKKIKPAYKVMEKMGANTFYVRFLGALLFVIKADNWAAQQGITSHLKVTYEKDGETNSFLLGRK